MLTWRSLLGILQNMEKVGHSCLDERVSVLADDILYTVDLYESLTTGAVMFTISIEETDDGG